MMTDHDSEMRMVRQMCGLSMRENQPSTELGEENMCRQYETWREGAGLGWHGCVDHMGDSDWVKPCSMLVVQTNKNCVCADMHLLQLILGLFMDHGKWKATVQLFKRRTNLEQYFESRKDEARHNRF